MTLTPFFTHTTNSQILTLQFSTLSTMQAALARIQAFHECKKTKNKYMPLIAHTPVKAYQGYNMPVHAIHAWNVERTKYLAQHAGNEDKERDENEEDLKEEERCVLQVLELIPSREIHTSPREYKYLIAHLTNDLATLMHEKQHAYYYLYPELRELAAQLYSQLPKDIKKVVNFNLQARGYDEDVWIDEFQAYARCNIGEFGNKARRILPEAQYQLISLCNQLEKRKTASMDIVAIDPCTIQRNPLIELRINR